MYLPKGKKSLSIYLGFVTILLVVCISGVSWYWFSNKPASYQNMSQGVQSGSLTVNLVLEKTYICGPKEEETLKKTVASIDKIYQEYHDWQLITHQDNTFVFQKKMQDIAPVCKEKGYFGLSENHVLSLFEGPPQDQKVIQTFFQIDTKKIEASLPNELGYLNKGIRIKDLAEYNSILSTYEEFADWSGSPHAESPQE